MAALVVAGPVSETLDAVHAAPIWRDRSDFVVGARLEESGRTEQMWARRIGTSTFEICCIPFFVYDLALGDVVRTDEKYEIVRVVERSGRTVFRLWFGTSSFSRDEIAEVLRQLGALLEWSSLNLLAVDAADSAVAQTIADYLQLHQSLGHLRYETGAS